MKHILALLLLSALTLAASAQSTAQDWQKADCDGNTYGLYDMCDSGNVVIMEFVMMNCSPCVTAAKLMRDVVAEFEQTHPGRVKIFSISFNNTTTCNALRTWKTSAECTWPVIANGKDILEYYGGQMAMPTVIAVSGADKKVIFNSLDDEIDGRAGFAAADVPAFKTAISNGLAQSSVKTDAATSALYTLYPNPASNMLRIQTTSEMPHSYKIVDGLGKVLLSGSFITGEVHTSSLAGGAYTMLLTLADGSVVSKQFTVTR